MFQADVELELSRIEEALRDAHGDIEASKESRDFIRGEIYRITQDKTFIGKTKNLLNKIANFWQK